MCAGRADTAAGVILRLSQAVDIGAPPSAVFRLISDPLAKARLHPEVRVVRIEREDAGPLAPGSVTFYRLQTGRRIFEYRMRCLRCEPDRLIESIADLPTRFAVRLEIEATPEGSRLTHSEECEVTAEMLEGLVVTRRAEHAWTFMKLLAFFLPGLADETLAVLFRERADALRVRMQRELRAWLLAMKQHLESGGAER